MDDFGLKLVSVAADKCATMILLVCAVQGIRFKEMTAPKRDEIVAASTEHTVK